MGGRRVECTARTALQRTAGCAPARSSQRARTQVVDASRRPARETVLFAVALVALATLGGIDATAIASGAPDAGTGTAAVTPSDGARTVDPDAAAASAAAGPPKGSFEYDGARIVVDQAGDQQLAGTTSLESGSQVTVRVRSSDSAQPFLRQTVGIVDEDGSFAASVDFDQIDRGVEFSAGLYHDGTELATAPGVVGGCDPTCGEPVDDAAFSRVVYPGTAGDALETTVELSERDSAFVRVGEDDTGVTIPFTVTDGNGDGTVTVVLETNVDASDAGAVRRRDDRTHGTDRRPGDDPRRRPHDDRRHHLRQSVHEHSRRRRRRLDADDGHPRGRRRARGPGHRRSRRHVRLTPERHPPIVVPLSPAVRSPRSGPLSPGI